MTFADLMTLLMCFFVLMLSFSEMDVAKFKQLAGSMQEAFGVQADLEVKTIPKGTSVVANEFSPGRPQPTAMNTIRQFTVNTNMSTLDVGQKDIRSQRAGWNELTTKKLEYLKEELKQETEDGSLFVRREGTNVILQILERSSFASGSASLESSYLPVLAKIGALLNSMSGAISISGHTDNVPIYTSKYRSNWDLSAARAATVAHEILATGIDPARVMISGHADTQPRAPNDSAENRALNRRIDITLLTNRDRHSAWIDEDAD
jgi:chemotaxis protein MotB